VTTFRFFRGAETGQLPYKGGAAIPDAWYYEPTDYEGDVLWSAPFATKAEARAASRGGRPRSTKRGSSVAGSKIVSIRVSAAEHRALTQSARLAGHTTAAAWLRELGLRKAE
jgi:hypothetical protein